MFYEDNREDKEVEKEVREQKGSTTNQSNLREDGFVKLGGEVSLDQFEDPKMDTSGGMKNE